MQRFCPRCKTEMIERLNVYVCPRNDIGDCTYDAFDSTDGDYESTRGQSVHSDLRSFNTADSNK